MAGHGTTPLQLFEVPYWNATSGPEAKYPPFSRVNHAKVGTEVLLGAGDPNGTGRIRVCTGKLGEKGGREGGGTCQGGRSSSVTTI